MEKDTFRTVLPFMKLSRVGGEWDLNWGLAHANMCAEPHAPPHGPLRLIMEYILHGILLCS